MYRLHDQGLVPSRLTLDKTKASYVDVIHSGSGMLGTKGPAGHVVFWANGGRTQDQPGCKNPRNRTELFESIVGTCGHALSLIYYERAVLGEVERRCPCQFRRTAPFKQPCPKPKNCRLTTKFGVEKLQPA